MSKALPRIKEVSLLITTLISVIGLAIGVVLVKKQVIRIPFASSAVTNLGTATLESGNPFWERHTIDDSSKGADGVRLLDINNDGLTDITTGWEQGKITRVYINPGPTLVPSPWPVMEQIREVLAQAKNS